MKFAQSSTLIATYKDIELAGLQGSITGVQLNDVSYGKYYQDLQHDLHTVLINWAVLFGSAILFGFSLYIYNRTVTEVREAAHALNEPLVTLGVSA